MMYVILFTDNKYLTIDYIDEVTICLYHKYTDSVYLNSGVIDNRHIDIINKHVKKNKFTATYINDNNSIIWYNIDIPGDIGVYHHSEDKIFESINEYRNAIRNNKLESILI